MSGIAVHPVTPERWPDMVELFERRGPRGGRRNVPAYGCWCMYWRDRSLGHGTPKKRAMGNLVRKGREPGLLAYEKGKPIGWIALAPREHYAVLLRSPQYRPRDEGGGSSVWSVVCFAIDPDQRRHGLAAVLLDAAVAHAFVRGATSIEAYPHNSSRTDYMGYVELYRRAGFASMRDANRRSVVRLEPA